VSDRIVSHYRILDKIGGGGMGVVYKALDAKLGRTVALKFLPPDVTHDEAVKKRLIHEAQAASLLDHPHICNIHEIGETPDGQVFISMAYYEGTSLKDRISEGPMPVREVFEIVYSIADGLSKAHEHGIVHRDIKPGNIVITEDGFVKIVDFGLAKIADRSRLTREGMIPGTIAYLSPEQISGDDVDGRSDIWSLGVLAYQALTGEIPFQGDIDAAIMYRILNSDPAALSESRSDVPVEFEEVIRKCLQKDPSSRYQSASELLHALIEVGRKQQWYSSGTVRSVMRIEPRPKPGRRRLTYAAAMLAVIVAVVLGAWLVFGGGDESGGDMFSTATRVAVLPVENLSRQTIPRALADGLSEWITGALEQLGGHDTSMWVVPFYRVQLTTLGTPRDASGAFGVNRLVRGSIQRFGDGHRLVLELIDAHSLRRLGDTHVDFDGEMAGLQGKALERLAGLFDMPRDLASRPLTTVALTAVPSAAREYLEGLGYLQEYKSGDNLGRALQSLRRATQKDPLYADALAALALAKLEAASRSGAGSAADTAWAMCQRAFQLDSNSVYVNMTLAKLARRTGRTDAALATFSRVLTLDPRNTSAYRHSGDVFNGLDRVDEAERAYRAMIEVKPDYWEGYINLGYFLSRRGRVDESIEQYEAALALAPNDWWTLNTLGTVYSKKDEWSKARQYFLRSFAVRPRCYPCVNIGTLYYLDGLFEEAAKYFKFAMEYCDSTAPDYYQRWQDWGAALYWVEGRREEASAKFRRAVQIAEAQLQQTPDDIELLAYTAGCYAMLDDREHALALVDRVTRMGKDNPMVAYHVGWTYEKLGDRERALTYLTEAVRLHYSIAMIRAEPLFRDLVEDIRFKQLVASTSQTSEPNDSAEP
jgi:tetratricopeptide (TPR) repeat protein/TolB-like protein/predicted Ser/Thr protein kinase